MFCIRVKAYVTVDMPKVVDKINDTHYSLHPLVDEPVYLEPHVPPEHRLRDTNNELQWVLKISSVRDEKAVIQEISKIKGVRITTRYKE